MKRILALILVLLAVTSIMATTFHTTHLSAGDILRASQVRMMTQDPVGFIWMGTDHGLYRYDGYTMHQVHPRTAAEAARYSEAFIHHVSMWGDRYLLLRLRGNVYVCYDLQAGRYVDFVHGADAGTTINAAPSSTPRSCGSGTSIAAAAGCVAKARRSRHGSSPRSNGSWPATR